MIKAGLGHRLDDWLRRGLPFLFRRPLSPDLLTAVGVAISLGAAVAFGLGAFVAGGLLLLAGGFFDLIDGVVARHHGTQTPFGAFLDSTMDRLVDMAVLFGIAVHYGLAGSAGLMVLCGVVLCMSVLTSYAKARAELMIPALEGGLLERGERVGLLAAGALFGWMPAVLGLLAAGTTFTVAQRFVKVHRALAKPLAPVQPSAPAAGGDEEASA